MKTNSFKSSAFANKYLIGILVLFFTLSISSCKFGSKVKLQEAVDSFAKDLPYDLGTDLMSITGCTYDNDMLTIECTVDDKQLNFSALKEKKDAVHENGKVALQAMMDNKDFAELINLTIDAGASLRYKYIAKSSKESFDIVFDTNELREIRDSGGHSSSEDLLKAEISSGNLQLPQRIDEVTTCTSITMEGADVIYNYVVDENDFTVDQIRGSQEAIYAMKKSIIDELKSDRLSRELVDLCVKCNKYLVYHYTGNRTSQTLEIRLSPQELKSGSINAPAPQAQTYDDADEYYEEEEPEYDEAEYVDSAEAF